MRVCPGCGLQTDAQTCPNDGLITMDASLLEVVDPLIGQVVGGKYTIEAKMGGGGMGAVYKARHTATGGLAALKVMRPGVSDSADAIKRFHLEAQNAAALHSMHTVRILDFGVDDGLLYLVMEYLEGQPLNDVIHQQKQLPWRRVAAITRQVLESLWEAHNHERRIVHRDIKPPNIFLVRKVDGQDFVKVIDFGIARALDSTGAGTRGAIGTPHAMAPEQWRGEGVDGRTDLYAVGCVMYEMLAGRPPFVGRAGATPNEKMMQLANAHITQVPHPIDELVPTIPPALANLVHQLLQKDADLRPESAKAAIVALDRCSAAPAGASAVWGDTQAAGVEIATVDLPTFAPGAEPSAEVVVRHTPEPPGSEAITDPDTAADTLAAPALNVPTPAFAPKTPTQAPPSANAPVQKKRRKWVWIVGLCIVWGAVISYMQRDSVNVEYRSGEEPGSKVVVKGLDDPGEAEEMERFIENAAESLSEKVEEWTGDKDEIPRQQLQLLIPKNATATSAGDTIAYVARLSDQDHTNSRGKALSWAHHIVVQDRTNFHRYQRRDDDDQADPLFADKRARRALRRMVKKALDKDTSERIVRGTPLIKLTVESGGRSVNVQIVDE